MASEAANKGLRRYTLQVRSAAFVLSAVSLPIFFALAFDLFDLGTFENLRNNVGVTSTDAARLLEREGTSLTRTGPSLEILARQRSVRLRVFSLQGQLEFDTWYGTDGVFETRSVFEHPVLAFARQHRRAVGCELQGGGRAWLCSGARYALDEHQTPRYVVVAQQMAPRTLRSLKLAPIPLLKMLLFVLVMGALLGYWIWEQLVLPVKALRKQVLERAAESRAIQPIVLDRNDEFGDLADAFNKLLQALEARTQANETFVADLAHELKNPVAAVRACAESMARSEGLDPARAKRLARVLEESGQRLDAVVTRFMELARAEAGLHSEARVPVALAPLLSGVASSVQADEWYKSLRFQVQTVPLTVLGEPGQLETALRNVLENAASFSPEQGSIEVTLTREEAQAVVRVRDHGPGIAPEHLPKLFDRFFTTRRSAKGTGLGLSLTKAIVEAHRGSLTAHSTLGDGATFTLRFPCAK